MNTIPKRILTAVAVALSVPAFADTVNLSPGETLDWAKNPVAKADTLAASGGTISNLTGEVKCRIELSGEVQVVNAPGKTPRLYSKIVKTAEGGCLVFGGDVSVGGPSGNYAFVDDGVLAFAAEATAAKLIFEEYTTCWTLPQFWATAGRHVYKNGSCAIPFRANAVSGNEIVLPAAESGRHTVRFPSAGILDAGVTVKVPYRAAASFHPMTINAKTYAVSTTSGTDVQAFSNDVVFVDGGRFQISAEVPATLTGDFSSANKGEIYVEAETGSVARDRKFTGSLDGMAANSTLTVAEYGASKSGLNFSTRVASGFPGTVVIEGSCPSNIVSFGVSNLGNKTTVKTLAFGAIQSTGTVTPSGKDTFRGPLLQYNVRQRWQVGRLSGQIAISPSQESNPSELAVDEVADGADIWIRYGMKLTFGNVGKNVRVHYMENSAKQPNDIVVTGSGTLAEIELQGTANTVRLTNVSADAVTGAGKIAVVGGACRLGQVPDAVAVDVQAGSVKFGSDANSQSVVAAEPPALWLDASATARMLGAWNAGWAGTTAGKAVLAANPKTTLNGADTATYDGHPLIEKWFDCRADQNKNYGWQYRCYGYSQNLYTLVYPYLVENGLNGKPYMCFGSMGDTKDTEVYGLGGSKTDEKDTYQQERRRMPFMQGLWDNAGTKNFEGHGLRTGTAILVFGSQQGGGRAMLGGYSASSTTTIAGSPNGRKKGDKGVLDDTHDPSCSANFQRGGSAASTTADTPIFDKNTNLPTWLGGVSVCPTNTGFNGGWQIVSFTDSGRNYSRSLGMSTRYAFAGGQNYAEVLIYSNVLKNAERQAVEEYLAAKWGLPHAARKTGNVTVAKGACASGLVSGAAGDGLVLAATGADELTMSGAWDLTFAGGAFAGVISEPGKRLVLPANLTVGLKLADKPASGKYVLAKAQSISGAENITVQFDPAGLQRLNYTIQTQKTADGAEIVLTVQGGFSLMVR